MSVQEFCPSMPERNMTDKELLEAAARAAGMPAFASGATGLRVASDGCKSGYIWNPLTDDGDALRLVVELMLTITMRHHECEVFDEDGQFLASESLHCPPDARQELVRRAIVRAAAEIGSLHNAGAEPREASASGTLLGSRWTRATDDPAKPL